MSFRLPSLGWGVGLTLVCSVAMGRAQTEAKTHGRSLELSEPTPKDVVTNLNQLTGRPGMRQLEDELSKSLQPFTPRGSLDGVMAPRYIPPSAVVPSRKLKDELERRQNWMYLSPDDLLPGMEDPDLLKMPDGTDGQEKKKSPLEQFYERLEREQKAFTIRSKTENDPLRTRDPLGDDSTSQEDSKMPGTIRDRAQGLRKLLGDDNSSSSGFGSGGTTGSSFSDLFGLGGDRHELTKEDIEKHKAYMDEYRKVLEGSTPMPSLYDPIKAAATPSAPASYDNLNGLMMTTTSKLTPDQPSLGTLGTVMNPALIPDPNATVLNQWNPFYNPQAKVDAPKTPTQFSVPLPEAPRRRF